MLDIDNTVLLVIDVQGKLANMVHEHERLLLHIHHFVKASEAFNLPILWTEQAPHKIGETVASIKDVLVPKFKPIHKTSFSCYQCPDFLDTLRTINKRQIIVTGIETHVCVYQTVRDLHAHGYQVHLMADAVSSRHKFDHDIAIARMRDEGITITSAEMVICELLKSADHPKFKQVMAYIKK